jgi:hypothetical protein
MMHRLLACALAPFALLAAVEPAGSPAPAGADHVYALAGTFACRTLQGAVTHVTGTRAGDVITAHEDVVPQAGAPSGGADRYALDPGTRRWKVTAGGGSPRIEMNADADAWTDDTWTVEGGGTGGKRVLTITKLLPDGGYRRIFAVRANNAWETFSAARCVPGTEPPAADACIVPNYPAHVLAESVGADLRTVPPGQPSGVVEVVVSLDAQSHVTGTRVQSSPSVYLSSAVMAAARRTTYRTEIRDCKPVPSEYLFRVTLGN